MSRILACLALGAWVLLLRPYPVTTFLAGCVACVSYPLYRRLLTRFTPTIGISLYGLGLTLLTALPLVVVAMLVTPQAANGLRILDSLRESGWLASPEAAAWFSSVDIWLKHLPGLDGGIDQVARSVAGLAGTAARTVLAGGLGLAGGALQAVFVLFLFVMITLLCVSHGEVLHEFALRLSTFSRARLDRFITATRGAIFAVMAGVVFVALIQGFLCGVGFSVADVPQAAFWGLLAAFVAPIPFVGTALVWLPICLWLWFTGSITAAISLAIWCSVVVAGVDNLLRPFFLKTGIKTSVLVLVLAILCGLASFGPVGIFAGPVLVAVAIQAGRESALGPEEAEMESDI